MDIFKFFSEVLINRGHSQLFPFCVLLLTTERVSSESPIDKLILIVNPLMIIAQH